MKMFPEKQNRFAWQILIAAILVAVVLLSGCTYQTPKVYHVGIMTGSDEVLADTANGFKAKMTELGYIEGKNILYDMQSSGDNSNKTEGILKGFIEQKVDLIFTYPASNAFAAKTATQGTGIPIVFAITTIEGNNLVESVRQPGGNITGVRHPAAELTVKRLELLLELAPRTKRVWLAYKSNYPPVITVLKTLRPAAYSMNITLIEVPVNNVEEINADLKAREKDGTYMDAIMLMPEPILSSPSGWDIITKFATEHKIPIAGLIGSQIRYGAVLTYFPENYKAGELAAPLVDKILKGTPAGTIPVITPEADLRINYKLAQELGINVSDSMLSRAKEIIR
jgi:putative ABC transport system substrate-binding protein